ncbi:MAG: DUF5063 domain-containing protein [Bacteroidales bacterium]|nr:DUF5063 domain-containing protein [Bacteroidales bacterium]
MDITNNNQLSNNELSVLALANEYCRAIELCGSTQPEDFINKMIKLLPRIYIAVTDLQNGNATESFEFSFSSTHLDEEYYNQICSNIAATMGSNDSYLETFHQDMKYSDSPIAATVSESLADIFQVLYNFIEDVREASIEEISEHLQLLRTDFTEYWSQILCNVMCPLNEIVCGRGDDINDEMDFI